MKQNLRQYFGISFEPLKLFLTYIILLAGGCLLLILVNMLPNERIKDNILASVDGIIKEGNYPYMGVTDAGYSLDNWTEAVLLSFYYTSDSDKPVRSAFIATAYSPQGATGIERLQLLIKDADWIDSPDLINRSSYWLGYGIILRPLLLFFNYQTCRMLLSTTSYIFLMIIIVLMTKRLGSRAALGFGITLTLFHYYTLSIQYTLGIFCIFVAYISILFLLYYDKGINYFYFMFIVGILASYFEWFSIPLITFGLPILVILQITKKEDINYTFANYFNIVFQSGFGWIVGYAIMVFSKTVIAMSLIGSEAWGYFDERLTADSANMQNRDFIKALLKLVRCVFPFNLIEGNWSLAIVLGLILIAWIIVILFCKKNRNFNIIVLLVAGAPFPWYWVFKGHIKHTLIDYRMLMISYYAGWIFLGTCFDMAKDWLEKKLKSKKQ